MNKNSK